MTNKTLTLSSFLPYRLSVLSNKISQGIASLYQDKFEINSHEWRIMAILGEQSSLSAAEVANRTAMDKVAVSRAVKKLLAKGQIERHFSDEDKRRSVLSLSETGLSIYQQVVPMAKEYEEKIVSSLTKDEQKALNDLLNKLENKQSHFINH